MHTGRFKLEKSTLAIGDVDGDGQREFLSIPAGEIVKLIAEPSPGNKMVDVLWQGRMVAVCAIDLKLWGIESEPISLALGPGPGRSM